MDHLLNLHAVAKAVTNQKVGVLYNKINAAFKGAYGMLDAAEIAAVEKVIKEDNKKVLEHLKTLKGRKPNASARRK